ncbi:hypothetical protein [Sphingobacterium faecium]|uniref:hypothetical protein n=1 Tax=Sphingobacterium faecium TaxID=34087 RepID=UPI0024695A25|nr:hypothetical protein [Sphingobacterium faecium]MDH5825799.1 hypothetical protein [Sphingobacterium faecium]
MVKEIKVSDRLPKKGVKVLWIDSRGSVENQEFGTSDEIKDLIGWCFDSWIEISKSILNRFEALRNCEPIQVHKNVFDIAPERHEIIQTN